MNIEWDYNYYQPWSDNEWLVDEMLVLLDKDIKMHYCIVMSRTQNIGLGIWIGLFGEILDYFLSIFGLGLNGTTLD